MNAIVDVEVGQLLQQKLDKLKAGYNTDPYPSLDSRKQKLTLLKQTILNNQQDLVEALSADFGYRSEFDTAMTDVLPTVAQINYTLKRLNKWCKPSRRHAGLLLAPSKVTVEYQPVGVVGIISPWNFPVILSLSPLVTALAAGNRVMMKLSEFTPMTNKVISEICRALPEDVEVVEGEAEVAQAFSKLPFDHLLFTGSTNVGRAVARAAAENLTPITLELGGKSPVIVADDANLNKAVDAILFGKCINAGQICVAPDYAFVPEGRINEFVALFLQRFEALYLKGQNDQAKIMVMCGLLPQLSRWPKAWSWRWWRRVLIRTSTLNFCSPFPAMKYRVFISAYRRQLIKLRNGCRNRRFSNNLS